jgi:uncharacterized protein (DUF58 family)
VPLPTRRLAAAAAVASALVLLAPVPPAAGFLAVNVVLVLAAAVDIVLAPSPASLGFEREVPEVLALGGQGAVIWRLRNPSGLAVQVRLADDLTHSLRPESRRATLRVRARGRAVGSTMIHPARRGRFEIRQVTIRVLGPIGFAARQRTIESRSVLRVYPSFKSRSEAELRINKARILEVGLRSAQGRGGGTEFDQLREYSVDDEFRRVDWAATARMGKPIVKTFRAERNQTVINLLDNGRVMAGRVSGVPRVEHAMDAVMALTAVATRLGDRAGLVAFDRRIRVVVPPGHSRDHLGRVTEAMYRLEPELAESDYRGAFVQTMARFKKRSMLVIYTDLVEQAVGESLLPALPLILRSHIVVVAAVRDPEVESWSVAVPDDAGSSYRKAAAVEALADRDRTAARLRGMGATVVDAPVGRLAPLLADAYLQVKATGRL